MTRTRDPVPVGRPRFHHRVARTTLAALLFAAGALAQVPPRIGAPYTESEAIPASLRAEGGEAPLALWSLRITGSTLRPRESDVSYTVNSNGSCFYVTAGDANTIWNVPILLENGSRVDTLRIYYYDTSASNLSAWFTVYDLYGAIVDEWSVASTGSSGNSFSDSVQINHIIDQGVYSYAVNVRPIATGATLQFCGVRLFYAPPPGIFSDGFESGNTIRWSAVTP